MAINRVVICLLVTSALLWADSSLVSQSFDRGAQYEYENDTLAAGIDYVDREVVAIFSEADMPRSSEVSLLVPRFGDAELDSVLSAFGWVRMRKLLPSYDKATSTAARFLERAFIVEFDGSYEAPEIAGELSSLHQFSYVDLNRILNVTLCSGTVRSTPTDTIGFRGQWYLDTLVTGDILDIDAPEAWAIEKGDPDVIIGIPDTGTMLNLTPGGWTLHSDFNHHWITAEDWRTRGKLGQEDVACDSNYTDDNGDGVRDNIVGHNYVPGYRCHEGDSCVVCYDPADEQIALRYFGFPVNWELEWFQGFGSRPNQPISWDIVSYITHGVRVGSIAAGRFDGPNCTGVAPDCQVYWLRNYYGSSVTDAVDMILHAASVCDVINMSWWVPPDTLFHAACASAANDSDCVLVAASGNGGAIGLKPPGKYAGAAWGSIVLSVGAIDESGNLWFRSQYDPDSLQVSVVAAGANCLWANSHSQCVFYPCVSSEVINKKSTGTSFAAPQASGLAALIRSRFPGMNQGQVRGRIENSAEYRWSHTFADSVKYGHGKINAYRALTEWGPIKTNVAWSTVAGGNALFSRDGIFYVSGNLTIENGGSLTINAGTIVRVAPDHERAGADSNRVVITVKDGGELNVYGKAGEPVVFESFTDASPTAHDWTGINFESGSSGTLKHVVIKNAQIGIQNFSPVTLKHAHISKCIEGIESHATLSVDSTVIDSTTSYGIEVVAGHATLDSVTISSCSMGIMLGGDNTSMNDSTSVTCTDVFISDLEFHGLATSTWDHRYASLTATRIEDAVYGVSLLSGSRADIDSCTIVNNSTGVLLLDCEDATVTKAVVDSNSTNGVYCVTGTDEYEITANYIRENSVGIFCYNSDPVIESGNTISNNTTGIKCNVGSDAVVEWNTISSNEVGVHALGGSDPDLGHETGGSSTGSNTIVSNDSFHVVNDTDSITIMAEKNWWGSSSGPDLEKISGNVDWDPPLDSHPGAPPSPAPPAGERDRDTEDIAELPTRFDLSPSYPNPFNPVTTMKFQVPPPGAMVHVAVYNVKGQMVKTLLSQNKAPGFYSLTWDGRSDRGDQVASGVYFVVMNAPGFTKTKKLVLLK